MARLIHLLTRSEGWCQVWHDRHHVSAWLCGEVTAYCHLCKAHRKPLRDEDIAW